MANEYDVLVIGSGTGGYVAAIRAAQLGLKTAVIERAPVLGGTCLNWGCIPTKALLEHAHALKVAQDWKEWGLTLGQAALRQDSGQAVGIDMGQVHARKDKIVKSLTGGIEMLFKKNKIDWIKGSGRLAGTGRVEITEGARQSLVARKEIVVATGSQPRGVPGIEIDRKRIITSDEAIHMKAIPKSIVILGSGAVGVEFGSIFRRFGSEVTIVELLPRLVPLEDEAVSAELEKSFKKQGTRVLTGTTVTAARAGEAGVELDAQTSDGRTVKLNAEYVLVATGRGPVTSGLGAEDAGLRMERGYIHVDKEFRTSVAGVSAIGDVITFDEPGHPQLAHLSSAEGIALAERIAGREFRPINYEQVPGCTYCDPEIGSVGLSEKKAQERGYDVKVGTFKFGVLARARIAGETEGFVKIVSEKKYDEILGVHMIGPRSTELVAEATLALRLECTVEELVRTIHAHPTMSEAVGEAAHAAHGAAIHA
ncbi:MAG: dihydrolipoyl dehydrogenase [Acidobacteria bacterium RIFCSPLOWO2_02_FULL_67_36]|nr:MAG: dihydrolipoyl dehydrogenase [Acidobacteria bacterium RIFCSPLOWO2_02_FULL_67_36]OFW23041.1 MAG: dihydrolipoyl dehydrogenase [Acidobacteria bacterium RIFCSPLOWO2_12_FULL_66_21]